MQGTSVTTSILTKSEVTLMVADKQEKKENPPKHQTPKETNSVPEQEQEQPRHLAVVLFFFGLLSIFNHGGGHGSETVN